MRRLLVLFPCLAAGLAAAAFVACASDDSGAGDDAGPDAAGDARDAHAPTPPPEADGGPGDAGADAPSTCEITRAYVTGCKQDLTCGDAKFDAWCAANDQAIDSAAFRRAEEKCLVAANCDPDKRRDCEYRSYGTATPTASETALVTAYCQTCAPSDVAGCTGRSTTYDADAGPSSTTDIFVAAWELADPIVDEIRTKCTGAALDGGTDAGACAKAFSTCSGDVYLAHLPDCPP